MSDKAKILLVDDELDIVDYLTGVFDGAGYECIGVSSPMEGIKKAKEESFAAIISDLKMPKMSGIEMISHIKTSPHNANTPVVILSGTLTDEMTLRFEKLGIIDVMSKPPEMDILLRIIEKAAKNRTKKTGRHYNPKITKMFSDAFSNAVKSHLADRIVISDPVVNERSLTNIEYCGMVTLLGRRLSGVLSISYQAGFTSEFARVMMGGDIAGMQLDIFESSAGEVAEQVAHAVVDQLRGEMGFYVESLAPLVVHGRHATNPLPATQPRVMSIGTLNGKNCYMEFALLDLAQDFAGNSDSVDSKIFIS
jgi:DNA-binding response OmpR family regulator